ncbi:hypothetical protein OK074_9108 [Actinobacteria bacterium OK074]|nr:hypothetical protein OK074_9108 [Actinobacteria bacterium OK074]
MSAATFTPAPVRPVHYTPSSGATALDDTPHRRHRLGDALRAIKVFAGAAVGVALLGEYGEEAGVRRRS